MNLDAAVCHNSAPHECPEVDGEWGRKAGGVVVLIGRCSDAGLVEAGLAEG